MVLFFPTDLEMVAMWSLFESKMSSCVDQNFPISMEIHLQRRKAGPTTRRSKRLSTSTPTELEEWLGQEKRWNTRSSKRLAATQAVESIRARSPPDEAEYQTTFIAYPRFDKGLGCIRLTKGDICRLGSEMFLNDSVIDFYFWYVFQSIAGSS